MFFIRAITYFNPRSSCEERPGPSPSVSTMARFQSTLLMRGATEYGSCNNVTQEISIHAPHARSDFIIHRFSTAHDNFNPRSSYEERRHECAVREVRLHISIHAPHTRSDTTPYPVASAPRSFQSTLLIRGATFHSDSCSTRDRYFNPRSSYEERPCPGQSAD